ncbi:hypothetical protein ACM55F_13325 [Flavobacterium sp. XS2P12]|uniref:FEKKY domain-containing protein n=1 Tax=Flavobacterium melibiosi TaxID=3398734 RepID=UPI003A882BF2
MKKRITIILVISLTFLIGIWIGKTKFKNSSISENEKEIDTAQVNEEREYENNHPTYSVQGGFPKVDDHYRFLVASKWYNFRFEVNGTTCTDPSNNDIDYKHNNITDSILKKRIGKNWKEKFEKTVDSLYIIDTTSVNIAKNDISVKNRIKVKSKKYKYEVYPNYKCYATPEKFLKIISIEWRGKIYNDSSNVSFMRVTVDIKANKVRKIEDAEMEWNQYR